MPFRLPFGFPYDYNNYYKRPAHQTNFIPNINNFNYNKNQGKKNPEPPDCNKSSEDSDYFFEIFGLRLHFDDVLIICILLFLYNEKVQDEELFLCLILLLLS